MRQCATAKWHQTALWHSQHFNHNRLLHLCLPALKSSVLPPHELTSGLLANTASHRQCLKMRISGQIHGNTAHKLWWDWHTHMQPAKVLQCSGEWDENSLSTSQKKELRAHTDTQTQTLGNARCMQNSSCWKIAWKRVGLMVQRSFLTSHVFHTLLIQDSTYGGRKQTVEMCPGSVCYAFNKICRAPSLLHSSNFYSFHPSDFIKLDGDIFIKKIIKIEMFQ